MCCAMCKTRNSVWTSCPSASVLSRRLPALAPGVLCGSPTGSPGRVCVAGTVLTIMLFVAVAVALVLRTCHQARSTPGVVEFVAARERSLPVRLSRNVRCRSQRVYWARLGHSLRRSDQVGRRWRSICAVAHHMHVGADYWHIQRPDSPARLRTCSGSAEDQRVARTAFVADTRFARLARTSS